MAMVLMGLGNFDARVGATSMLARFYAPLPGVDTPNFQTKQRDSMYTWIAQPRLSRKPAMQFTGPGEDTQIIEGRMYPYHFGGLSTLHALRVMGESGKPYTLIRFYPLENPRGFAGDVLGQYVIIRVRDVESNIGVIGIPHKIDFTLELKEYGGDPDDGQPLFGNGPILSPGTQTGT
jgi:phage protein U